LSSHSILACEGPSMEKPVHGSEFSTITKASHQTKIQWFLHFPAKFSSNLYHGPDCNFLVILKVFITMFKSV